MYKIEKRVEINNDRASYPFGDMADGDSFLVTGKKNATKARTAAYLWAKYHGKRAKTRAEDGGVRIWMFDK